MSSISDLATGLDVRMAGSQSTEHRILSILLVAFFVTYAGLGRDVFYNHLNGSSIAKEDPIGYVLPYLRVLTCMISFLFVTQRAGLTWTVSKIPILLAPFCVFALLSCLWAPDTKDALRNALALIALWGGLTPLIHRLGLVSAATCSLRVIAFVLIISTLLALLVPSVGRHTGLEIYQSTHIGRWRGIFLHKNALGPWAAYGSVLFFTHWRLCTGSFYFWWIARISALLCLVFSGDATAQLLVPILYAIWIFFMMLRRFSFGAVMTTVLLSLLVIVPLAVALGPVILSALGRDMTLTGRTALWDLAQQFIAMSPWIGSGFQTDGGPDFIAATTNIFGQPLQGPDNSYFSLLMDLGWVGLLLFFIPQIATVRNGFEWLKYVTIEDRAALELELMLIAGSLIIGITDSTAFFATGYDGVLTFVGFLALLTAPKSPDGQLRGEFRLAEYRLPKKTKRRVPRNAF